MDFDYLFIGEYFQETYWPINFVYWPIMLPTILASGNETFLVPYEDRYFQVFSECTQFIIPEEDRYWTGENG